ncbi:hypothetical protein D3C87_946940 [compost metagenome]
MGRQHDAATVLGDRPDDILEGRRRDDVEAEGGLVQQEELRRVEERDGDGHALLETARELADTLLAVIAQVQTGDELVSLGLHVSHSLEGAEVREILGDRELPVKVTIAFEDGSEARGGLGAVVRDVMGADGNATGGGSQEARDHLDRGGLAGPVGAEQTEDFTAVETEGDAVDGGEGRTSPAGRVDLGDVLDLEGIPVRHRSDLRWKSELSLAHKDPFRTRIRDLRKPVKLERQVVIRAPSLFRQVVA